MTAPNEPQDHATAIRQRVEEKRANSDATDFDNHLGEVINKAETEIAESKNAAKESTQSEILKERLEQARHRTEVARLHAEAAAQKLGLQNSETRSIQFDDTIKLIDDVFYGLGVEIDSTDTSDVPEDTAKSSPETVDVASSDQ